LASEALTLRQIDAYYGDSHALQQVSFTAAAGRLLGLVGRNGAGKTTAMNVAVGLLPPRAGSVEVFGSNVAGFTPEAIAHVPPLARRHVIVNGTYDFSPSQNRHAEEKVCVSYVSVQICMDLL